MIKLNKLLNEAYIDSLSDDEIRSYAWLYFLVFVYPNGLDINIWENDKRFGISFHDAMAFLLNSNLIVNNNTKYVASNKAKDVLYKVFGKYNSRASAEQTNIKRLNKISGKQKFPIESIPYEIYDRDNPSKNNKHILKYDSRVYLEIIKKWFLKYQRDPSTTWDNKLNKYTGLIGDLVSNNPYVVYRGMQLDNTKYGYKLGDKIKIRAISWSTSINVATGFSNGSKHWLDTEKLIPGKTSIILKTKLNPKNILLDTNYIDETHPYLKDIVEFPDEYEIINSPLPVECKVYKIKTN